jgi:hypothetical protein
VVSQNLKLPVWELADIGRVPVKEKQNQINRIFDKKNSSRFYTVLSERA